MSEAWPGHFTTAGRPCKTSSEAGGPSEPGCAAIPGIVGGENQLVDARRGLYRNRLGIILEVHQKQNVAPVLAAALHGHPPRALARSYHREVLPSARERRVVLSEGNEIAIEAERSTMCVLLEERPVDLRREKRAIVLGIGRVGEPHAAKLFGPATANRGDETRRRSGS